jgi:small subunit ribosomal protein S21
MALNMAIQVLVKDNNVEAALKAIKRKGQREGIFKDVKLHRFFEKPSERKLRKTEEARKRRRNMKNHFDFHAPDYLAK